MKSIRQPAYDLLFDHVLNIVVCVYATVHTLYTVYYTVCIEQYNIEQSLSLFKIYTNLVIMLHEFKTCETFTPPTCVVLFESKN